MVASVSLKKLLELINSVQQDLRNKSNIQLDTIIKLSGHVKSSKEVSEKLSVLRNVVKLFAEIYGSGKGKNEEENDQLCLLLGDCINGIFDLLKNEIIDGDLCNDVINAVLVMSENDSEAPNMLLKRISDILVNIIIYPKFDLKLKRDFLKTLNFILESSDRQLRYKIRSHLKLEKLSRLLYTCGDYDFQINLIETIFRYTSMEDRKFCARKWLNDQSNIVSAFLNIVDFEPDCRTFLNIFNNSFMNDRLVYSIPCSRAIIGNCEVKKPEHPSYEEFWVDFNLGSKSLSLVCSQESLYSHSILANQAIPGLWETILIESQIIKKVNLQQISLPMDSQGPQEKFWELQLILCQPCNATFSSFPCNFEGNLCIFIFHCSNAVTVHAILQQIFSKNYFSDMDSMKIPKKRCKSSVSSLECYSNSEFGSYPNMNVSMLSKYPFKIKSAEENKNEVNSKGLCSSQMLGSKNAEVMAKHMPPKEYEKGFQAAEKLPNLSSKSKKQKSPFKPLEIVISPSNLNKKSKNPKKDLQDQRSSQKSAKSDSFEFTTKGLDVIKANERQTESTSNSNKNVESCIDNASLLIHSKSSKQNKISVMNETDSSKKEPSDMTNKEKNTILAEDTDENSDIMEDSKSKANRITNKILDKSCIKNSSKNDYAPEKIQGRVLRSHKRAQYSLEVNEKKVSATKGNEIQDFKANDGRNSNYGLPQMSKFVDIESNDSDSDDEWLKEKIRKLTARSKNKSRSQSLGILHMKQLHNKEAAMEKAIKKSGRAKAKSLKPIPSSSHNDESEHIPCKKKLFNNKDQSFLGMKVDNKINMKKLTIASDARNDSAENEEKKANSVISVNWFSENDSDPSWLKSKSKDRVSTPYINKRKTLQQRKEPYKKAREQDGMPDENYARAEDLKDENPTQLSENNRDSHTRSAQRKCNERNTDVVTEVTLDGEGSRLQVNKKPKNTRKKAKENPVHNERRCQKNKIKENTESLVADFDARGEGNDLVLCRNENFYENEIMKNLELKTRTLSKSDGQEKQDSRDPVSRFQNESISGDFKKPPTISQEHEKQVTNKTNQHEETNRQPYHPISNENSLMSDVTEESAKFPYSKNVNGLNENQKKKSSNENSAEIIISEKLNHENAIKGKETVVENTGNNSDLPVSKSADEAVISSKENPEFPHAKNGNSLNESQRRKSSNENPDEVIISGISRNENLIQIEETMVDNDGNSAHLLSSKYEDEAVTSSKDNPELPFTKNVNGMNENQKTSNEISDEINISENPSKELSIKRKETAVDNDRNSLHILSSKYEDEAVVSSKENPELHYTRNVNSLNENERGKSLNEDGSPDVTIISGNASNNSSMKRQRTVVDNDGNSFHQISSKHADEAVTSSKENPELPFIKYVNSLNENQRRKSLNENSGERIISENPSKELSIKRKETAVDNDGHSFHILSPKYEDEAVVSSKENPELHYTRNVNSLNENDRGKNLNEDGSPDVTIISGNASNNSSMKRQGTVVDNDGNSFHQISSKHADEAVTSSKENPELPFIKYVNSLNENQRRKSSNENSGERIISENPSKELSIKRKETAVDNDGHSFHILSPKYEDEAVVSSKENPELHYTRNVNSLNENDRGKNLNEDGIPDVTIISDNRSNNSSMKRQRTMIDNDGKSLHQISSKYAHQAVILSKENLKIPFTKNVIGLNENQRRKSSNEDGSPDVRILSEYSSNDSSMKMKRRVVNNDRSILMNRLSAKQADDLVIELSPEFHDDLSSSNNNKKMNRTHVEKPRHSFLNKSLSYGCSKDSRLEDNESLEDFLIPQSIPVSNSKNYSTLKSNFLGKKNDTEWRGSCNKLIPEREGKNPHSKKILSKPIQSLSTSSFDGSSLDLDMNTELTEDDEIEDQVHKNSTNEQFVVKEREDKPDLHISIIKEVNSSKRKIEALQRNISKKTAKYIHEKTDLGAHFSKRHGYMDSTISSPTEKLEKMIADTSLNIEKVFQALQENDSNVDGLPNRLNINLNIQKNTPNNQSQELRRENPCNSSKSSSGKQSRKRIIVEPRDIQNSKVFQCDQPSPEMNLNLSNEKKHGPQGRKEDQHFLVEQENCTSEEFPDINQLVMARLSEKSRNIEEIGQLILKHIEDGMASMKENGSNIGDKMVDEYLGKLQDKIKVIEEAINKNLSIQEGLEKCMKYTSNAFSLKAENDASVMKGLKEIHLICKEMDKENKKTISLNYIDEYNLTFSSKIRQLHSDYVKMERKKKLAKVQNQLKMFLNL